MLPAYSSRIGLHAVFACKFSNGKRVEVRFPDATANPYLAFSAMLMAGLTVFRTKFIRRCHGQTPRDLSEELSQIPTVCGSLREALDALSEDRSHLTQGNVFTDEQIDAYIDLKMKMIRLEHTPHPVEFDIYTHTKPNILYC